MRPWSTRFGWAFVLGLGVLGPATSWSVTPAEKATAEALFDQGVTALKEGNPKLACEKLEQSQRIEPGVGVLLYLGECYERLGRTASAWAIFREAASIADSRGDDRAPVAKERAERLTARLSKLTITMEVGADADVPGLEITRDGEVVPAALWGSAVPVDPGPHVIVVTAPGYAREEVKVQVEGEAVVATVSVPQMTKLPPSKAVAPSPAPKEQVAMRSPLRPIGLGVGITGLVGLGVGAAFGGLAMAKNEELTDPNGKYKCSGSGCPDSDGVHATNQALTFATVSDVAFIAGGVLAVTGLTLFLAAPSARETARVSPIFAPGLAGLHLEGNF